MEEIVKAVQVIGRVATDPGWTGPATFAVTLFTGTFAAVIGILLFCAYRKTNKLHKLTIDLNEKYQNWEMAQKDPDLMLRRANLVRSPSGPAFVVKLELLNPGGIPIQLDEANVNMEGVKGWKGEKYSELREEYYLIKPYTPFKTDIIVNTLKAKDTSFWPGKVTVGLSYVSARTKRVTLEYEVQPHSGTEAWLSLLDMISIGDSTQGTFSRPSKIQKYIEEDQDGE